MIEAFRPKQFILAENISQLNPREKNAVKVVLDGLCDEKLAGKKVSPLKIIDSPENRFRIQEFAQAMCAMGIDIWMQSKKDAATKTYYCSPQPREGNDLIKNLISSRDLKDQFVKSFLDYEPSPIDSKHA